MGHFEYEQYWISMSLSNFLLPNLQYGIYLTWAHISMDQIQMQYPSWTKYRCNIHMAISVCRTLGIPARSVTNFSSAHDCDGMSSMDYHWTIDGMPLDDHNHNHVWWGQFVLKSFSCHVKHSMQQRRTWWHNMFIYTQLLGHLII